MPLQIIRRDITEMRVDAIVNTTNEQMTPYSGIDLAIHNAAGPKLDEECASIAPLGLGSAKITKGYDLPAKYVIHTSGPVWQGGLYGESIILKSCYLESLRLAVENGCDSVAFPLISSGAYGYPRDRVLKYAVEIISEFLNDHELEVYICIYDKSSYEFDVKLFEILDRLIHESGTSINSDSDIPEQEASFYREKMQSGKISERKECSAEKRPVFGRPAAGHKNIRGTQVSLNAAADMADAKNSANATLREYMKEMDKSFGYKLFDWIDIRGMTDTECYKKANVDKKTFSKIRCNPQTYKPSKQTAVAFAIALRLDIDETQDLLASAGLTLSGSFAFDKIIRYFIQNEIYDIFTINEALFEFDQPCLGC